MTQAVQAAVHMGDQRVEIRSFDRPSIPPDGALLRIDAAGVCGADTSAFLDGSFTECILGHENVGTIDEVGDIAAERWGVQPGDRVVLEEYLPCWHCEWCRVGEYRLCYATDRGQNPNPTRFGCMPVTTSPSLWGGYSQFLFLSSRTVLHPLPDNVPAHLAALTLPIANGIQWTVLEAGVGVGSTILIMGPGQQGLACVVAAARAGAKRILLAGLSADTHRLEVGQQLGAHITIDVEREHLEDRVREATDGDGPDVVVDATSSSSPDVLLTAIRMLKRKGGTLIAQGGNVSVVDRFPLGVLASKYITVKIARGHSARAVDLAIGLIASGEHDLSLMGTHRVGLHQVAEALRLTRDEPTAIHVVVDPWV